MPNYDYRRLQPADQLVYDTRGNLVGIRAGTSGDQAIFGLNEAEYPAVQALVSEYGNVLVHPKTYFQGAAGGQAVADGKFFDVAAGNHGVFGRDLSRAQAWANLGSGYISTVDPVVSFTDSVIRIPAPNFDYAGGESLLVFWAGQVTPDADVTIIDPDLRWTVEAEQFRSKSANSPFVGWELKGRATIVLVSGRVKYRL